jgi:putative ABC transport system substrate-binding protein
MRRRDFVRIIGSAAVFAQAQAQQPMPVVGYLGSRSSVADTHLVAAFHEGLKRTGYENGRNVTDEVIE